MILIVSPGLTARAAALGWIAPALACAIEGAERLGEGLLRIDPSLGCVAAVRALAT
jgi:hypothetical protein